MKKIISVFLSVILCIAVCVPVAAQETVDSEIPTTEETTTETAPEEETTDPAIPDEPEEDDGVVAAFSVCSCMSTPVIIGHTYIYVQNLSDEPLQVGLYEVPVGQGVSMGTLSFSVYDGWGIYYNIETYREPREGHFPQIWSKTVELDEDGVKKLNKKLNSYVNHWDPLFNCSFFAFSVWNNVTGDFLMPFMFPGLAHLVVMAVGEKGVLELYKSDASQVFKQRGTGDSAYLEPVGEKTLKIG